MAGALDGMRVIDFGQYIAGPMAAMLLADQGADVIRVDPPSGPRWDTPANVTWNRGKRSIALDLKSDGDLDVARRLIATADVVIENFRPGVMDRLGLGAEATNAVNPRVIYCSMPGFAADDARANVPAWEGVVAAATASYRGANPNAHPVYNAIPTASVYAAFQSAVAIAMALNARDRDGVGQRVEVPLFDGMFTAVGTRGLRVHNDAPGAPARGLSWTTQFFCADDNWTYFHTGNTRTEDVAKAAGVSQWYERGLFDRVKLAEDDDLAAQQVELSKELFRTRTAQEWEDLVAEAGGECGVCNSSAAWIDHDHARGSEIIIEWEHPTLGKLRQPGINVRMSGTPGSISGPAPATDQNRDEILAELDAQPESAAAPDVAFDAEMAAVLDGVKVLDLCIVLAGPTCGRTLAEFGAEVTKIDDPNRPAGPFHNDVNRGKRSILLDLKSEDGQAVFWKLVDDADVIVQNYRRGALERLGISYEEVKKRRPDIIFASLNAYGHVGPWADRPGHEQLAQAVTGMQVRYGGDGDRPTLQPFAINDYGTGLMGAYAVALALLHRDRTGEGQHVDTALTYTATMLQSPFMLDYEGKSWDEPQGQTALGSGPLHRAYRASDAWLFIGARESDLPRMATIDGLSGVAGLAGDALVAQLESSIGEHSVDVWVRRLAAADIGVSPVIGDVRKLMEDPWVIEHGMSVTREHDEIGVVTTNGPAVRMSRSPVIPGFAAPKPGSNAPAILESFGLGDRFDALVESGAVRYEAVAGD